MARLAELGPEPGPDVITSSSQRDVFPAREAILSPQPVAEAIFQIAAHSKPSLLLFGRTVWGAWLCHVTWRTVAAIGTLCVLTVTVCTECCRPVQVFTLVHIHTGHVGRIQLEALKAVTSVALPHTHAAAILTAIQDATFLSLKAFEGGQGF